MMSNVIELNFQTSLSQKVKLPYNVYHKKTSIFVIYLFIILLRQNIHCDIVLQLSIPTRHYDMLSILILGKTEKKRFGIETKGLLCLSRMFQDVSEKAILVVQLIFRADRLLYRNCSQCYDLLLISILTHGLLRKLLGCGIYTGKLRQLCILTEFFRHLHETS